MGPLTTLMGCYVPGGISGDIFISRGVVKREHEAAWSEARRKYGTDIATTIDNIADENTVTYEVLLGAKLHDITDEAKLSVMPAEVIGSALERLMHYQEKSRHLEKVINSDCALDSPISWGPERTGIPFINPGYTDVFELDRKIRTLVDRYRDYEPAIRQTLTPETAVAIEDKVAQLKNAFADNKDREIILLGIAPDMWVDILHQSMGRLLAAGDRQPIKTALSYLYSAAFVEFCGVKLKELGCRTFADVRKIEKHLGVDDQKAPRFYAESVEKPIRLMAENFYARRKKILEYASIFK